MGMRWTDAKIAALLAIGVALLFSNVLFRGDGFYVRDVYRDYLPSHFVLRSVVLRGEFPSWNRFYSGGQPLAANPGFQAFYPGTWLAFLPWFLYGFNLEIVLHVVLAAAGMYRMLRSMELRVTASLFGAAAFALGGCVLSLTNLLPFLASIAWWPWIVTFLRKQQWALFALALAMLLLAAEQSMILQTALIICAAAGASPSAGRPRAAILTLIAASLLALGIASVQIVPALDLMRDSGRGRPISYEDATAWSMPLSRPIELFLPHAFGRITDDGSEYRTSVYKPPRLPLIFSIYCGLVVPLLAAAGVVLRRAIWTWPLIALSYLLAIGAHGPLIPFLYRIGVFRGIRYPEKFALSGIFALIVLAAAALDRLGGRVAFFLLLITIGDLLLHMQELTPTKPRRFFTPPPVAFAVPGARGPVRIFHQAEWPVWGRHGIPIATGEGAYWSERTALLPFTPALYGLQTIFEIDINLTALRPSAEFLQSMWEALGRGAPIRPFLVMGNAGYLIVPGKPIRILRAATLPRYWFADQLVQFHSREEFVHDLTSKRWSDRAAFVEFQPFVPAHAVVLGGREWSNRTELRVRSDGTAFLVAAVTAHRYWVATIDGRPVPLWGANVGFQGIVVPGGEHAIRFEYSNPLFAIFGSITILCVIIVIIFHVKLRRGTGGGDGRDQAFPDLPRGGSDGGADAGHPAARSRAVLRSELARLAHRGAACGGSGPVAATARRP